MNMTRKIAALGWLSLALFLSYSLIQTPSLFGQAGGAPKGGIERPGPRRARAV